MSPSQSSRLTAAAAAIIRAYRNHLSQMMLPSCRFLPSCSAYALEAIQRHGVWRGGAQTIGRILRCHPFARGGVDPVRSR